MKYKIIENKNKEIIYKIVLYLNRDFFNDNIISYKTYKETEMYILKKINADL